MTASIDSRDAERIGAFAGIAGLMEVSLGSILHAYRVPLKGHFLAGLQNLMLVEFGKALNGRGLFRISFISAMLKAFSPMGNALAPMLYIFVQGSSFALPIRFLGWNFQAALLGSVLMGWITLGASLVVNYLMFGQSIFEAFQGAVDFVVNKVGMPSPTLSQIIIGAFLLKTVIALALGSSAYWGNIQPLIQKLAAKAARLSGRNAPKHDQTEKSHRRGVLGVLLPAFFDLLRPRFLVMFLLSILLMRFFVDLRTSEWVSLVIRGVCISYIGFLLIRRVDVIALGKRLDRIFGMDMAKSLPIALKAVGRSSDTPQQESKKK